MSTNLCKLELTSDVFSVGNHGFISAAPTTKVGSSDAETLICPVDGEIQTQELVIGDFGNSRGGNLSSALAGIGINEEGGCEKKVASFEIGIILEPQTECSCAKASVVNASGQDGDCSKVGEILQEEVKTVDCEAMMDSRSVFKGSEGVGNVGDSASLPAVTAMVMKVTNDRDKLGHDVSNNVSTTEQKCNGHVENEAMEVDEQANNLVVQNVAKIGSVDLEEIDRYKSGALKLFVDFYPYASAVGKVMEEGNLNVDASTLFSAYDLVWGKVRSHPWWPGQIINPSAASDKAKKYFKRDCYLIAFFGDQTFAWNEASRIKPFQPYFLQMEKQSSFEEFRYAVHCALDEVSRRVEFGLACSCIPDYDQMKTQIIVNPGIREDCSRMYVRDSFSSSTPFEPEKLSEYVKELGQLPFGEIDKLAFITAQAQLMAFNRWKGYSHLPEFQIHGALLSSDAEIEQSTEMQCSKRKKEDEAMKVKDNELVSSAKSKSKSKAFPSPKQKIVSGFGANPRKKERSLADLLADKCIPVQLHAEYNPELRSLSSGKKRNAMDAVTRSKCLSSEGDCNSLQPKRICGTGASPVQSVNGTSQTSVVEDKSKNKTPFQRPKVKTKSLSENCQEKNQLSMESFSADEIASQLWSMAIDPMKGYCTLRSVISFLVEFRNSVHPNYQKCQQPVMEHVSDFKMGEETTKLVIASPKFEPVKDSYWTDMIIESIPGEQTYIYCNNRGVVPEASEPLLAALSSAGVQNAVKPVDQLEKSCHDDSSLTALILNFTNLDSVPPKKKLNEIFSRYGALKKSETEVLKKSKRAKVVFFRRADAEAAFSSAGKYSIFGPSLASYRLKYGCSTPSKSSPRATPGSRISA